MNQPRWRLCLILLCTTQFVALLDFSITMIPLPQIQESLGFTRVAVSIAVLAGGGSEVQGFSYAIFVSTCMAVIGVVCAALILPGKSAELEFAR